MSDEIANEVFTNFASRPRFASMQQSAWSCRQLYIQYKASGCDNQSETKEKRHCHSHEGKDKARKFLTNFLSDYTSTVIENKWCKVSDSLERLIVNKSQSL